MRIEPKTLKGFRDFLPKEARKRQFVIDKLKSVFESYGFEPLETPALEYAEILLEKYGPEADKLIYRFEDRGGREVGLRYDLTVPLARVISQYQNSLPLPFKRYQIAPVWRADKPQSGRYREFWQADIDNIGSTSTISDADIVSCVMACMNSLGFKEFRLLINDRNIFAENGITEIKVIRALDKLPVDPDKQPGEEIGTIFRREKALSQKDAEKFARDFFLIPEPTSVATLKKQVLALGLNAGRISFIPWLARGLEYYTGIIFELQVVGYENLSIGGGGRYDGLIEKLAGRSLPGVGFSFGIDRVINAMEIQKLFPDELSTTKVLVTVFSEEVSAKSVEVASTLRARGINTEVYLDAETKMDKQLKYADQKGIPYVVIIGPKEAESNSVTVKNMKTGEQKVVKMAEIAEIVK